MRNRLFRLAAASVVSMIIAGAPSSAQIAAASSTGPTVTVSENSPLHAVDPGFAGFSIDPANLCYVVNLAQTDPAFVQLFENLGAGILRVGGDTGDKHASWSTTGPASCSWKEDVATPALVDSFFTFAESVGYQVMWQVPLDNGNLAEDAAEAAYVSSMPDVYSIQIGNEPNFYPDASADYQTYINDWKTVYQDYLADGGAAPVSGPDATTGASFYVKPFLAQDSADINALTAHYYQAKAKRSATCNSLLQMGKLNSLTADGAATAAVYGLPFFMTETNSYSSFGAPGVSNAFCSALWAADYMLTGMANGVRGIYFHGTADYPPGNKSGQVEYYTPINEDGGPAPEYYGMLFYHQVAQAGGNQVTASTSGAPNLDAFAVLGGDGSLRVALINRNGTASTVTVQTANPYSQASEISLTAPSLTSLSGVTLGGAGVASDGTWTPSPQPVTVTGTTSAITVPAYTGMVVTYSS